MCWGTIGMKDEHWNAETEKSESIERNTEL
jgi:hypothetical protein